MKTVYVYDKETKLFLHPRLLSDDDNTIIENSTEKPVPEGLWGKIKWTGQDWIGQTREEYEASLPKHDAKPSQSQQLLMTQQANITELQKTVMAQQSSTVQMQKLIMTQQAEIAQLKKGSN